MNRPLPILVCGLFALVASAVDRPSTPPTGAQMAELLAASIHGSPDVDIAVPNGNNIAADNPQIVRKMMVRIDNDRK
jgi:hypothetical protein